MAGRHGISVFLRVHGRRDRPVDALSLPKHDPDFSVDRQARLQPHHRYGGRSHQLHEQPERGRARQAVLPLLRARRHPFAASAEEGMDRQVQGQVRHGLGEAARADLRQPEAARGDPGEHPAHPLAGYPAEVGLALIDPKETLRAGGGGVCRLRSLYRQRNRPRHPGGRGHGQTRQHADHLYQRRQRHQRRRHAGGHPEPDDRLQRRSETP